ncbi:transporter, dicarboxylate/amino acid:cation Na+/H+ symporter family protein [Oesophagostomum dentatum]|uniref:Amino acid transporter n=1 Tax=Oesophagostomum dentatum TaxID=61180 RepID=A0A0B1SQQ8_OESDE|nr:transporter, dicarboxylate/amino acid:cation Na+/H+ symporter family protein [Oesophagostomum dentatum]
MTRNLHTIFAEGVSNAGCDIPIVDGGAKIKHQNSFKHWTLGIVIATVLKPGSTEMIDVSTSAEAQVHHGTLVDKMSDLLRNMFPENLIRSMFQQQQTIYKLLDKNDTDEMRKELIWTDGMNVVGLAIISFVTLPLVYLVIIKRNPFKFIKALSKALIHGIATSSSAASLPVTLECVKDLNVDPRVAKFVLTVGTILATIGTASYEAIAPIFIAQMNGITLDIGQLITLCVTASLASAGAATVPSSALITMIIVLSALGLPIDSISLIFTVDWLL